MTTETATTATPQPTLCTERLVLRPLQPRDAALLALYAGDARVARMTTSIPHPYPPGLADAFIARANRPGPKRVWAITLPGEEPGQDGLIGLISLKDEGAGRAEIGYWIAPAFWNTGFAGEALGAVLDAAPSLGLTEIRARVLQDNLASARVLARAGFEYLGEGETHALARGAVVPIFRYRRMVG